MTDTAHEPGSTAHDGPNHPEADHPGTIVEVKMLVTGATGLLVTAALDSQSAQVLASATLLVVTGSTYLVSVTVDFKVTVVVGSTQSTQV